MPFGNAVSPQELDFITSPLLAIWLLILLSLLAQLWKRSRVAMIANLTAVVIFWLTGTSVVTNVLVREFELRYVPSGEIPLGDAIVVLAGVTGRAYQPQPVPHLGQGADRLVYAAKLYKEGKAPLVIFSGNQFESDEMAEVMELLGVPRTAILEEDARLKNTYGGARDLIGQLVSHHVHKVLLVTSAIRMPRALAVFRHLGIDAIPAPTDFLTRTGAATQPLNVLGALVPNMADLGAFTAACHEFFGLVGYRLTGWI
jgi:uncharacterized SAM-binding protein YcdF (DUF218 family)